MKVMSIRSANDAALMMIEILPMSPVELKAWSDLIAQLSDEQAETLLHLVREEQDSCTPTALATVETYVAYLQTAAEKRLSFLRSVAASTFAKKPANALLQEHHPSEAAMDDVFHDERSLAEFLSSLSVFEIELIKGQFLKNKEVSGDARLTVLSLLETMQQEVFDHERSMIEQMRPMVRRTSDAIMLRYYQTALRKLAA